MKRYPNTSNTIDPMKKLFVFAFLITTLNLFAQERAITESGDTIYVYADGTWSYELDILGTAPRGKAASYTVAPKETSKVFDAPADNKTELKGANVDYTIRYHYDTWKRLPAATLNPEAEFAFSSKDNGSVYAMVIPEGVELGTKGLFNIALQHMEKVSQKPIEVVEQEYRTVNGKKLISAIIYATVNDLDVVYYGYYYSGEDRTIQFLTYTLQSGFERAKPMMEAMLNGLLL